MNDDKYGKLEDAITARLNTVMEHIEQLEEKIDILFEELQQSHAVASAPFMDLERSRGEESVQGKRATLETML
jgi:hypothetical protein